jgi:cobaltochelatase CobS
MATLPQSVDEQTVRAICGDMLADRPQALDVHAVRGLINDALKAIPPQRLEIVQGAAVRTLEGRQHKLFARFLKALATKQNVWLAGPAGSGKTTAAEKAAEALGVPFYFNGAIDTEYKLLGFIDAQGRIVSTAFREAFTNGGVYLFDEVDASQQGATLAFQAALANGYADFPGGMVRRHPDFYCVAAANTWGLGATTDYVGRNKLDAAFLDRFQVKLSWGYDEELERAIAGNDEWTEFVQRIRAKAKAKGLKVVISPRASIAGAQLIAAGFTMEETADMTVYAGLTADQRANVEG